MPRKNKWRKVLGDILTEISIVYVIFLSIFAWVNKSFFWKMLLWGIAFLGTLIVIVIFIKRSKIHKQSQWHTDRELLKWLKGLKPWEFENTLLIIYKIRYKPTLLAVVMMEVDVIAEKMV